MYFASLMFKILITFVEATKPLDLCVGPIFLCIERPPEDGTSVLKHIGFFFIIAYGRIFYSAFVGCCNDLFQPFHFLF
jgi:hypothetical protein